MYITENDVYSTYKDKNAAVRGVKKIEKILPVKLNPKMARIISYITFDGHLAKDLRQFLLISKNKEYLSDFASILKHEFGLEGKLKFRTNNWGGTSYSYMIFSSSFTRVLILAGAPRGKKTAVEFSVPSWIENTKSCAQEYLKMAFDCEGSVWKDKFGPKIRIKLHKSKKMLDNGIEFFNSIKKMLLLFDIETTKPWIVTGYKKGKEETVGICLGIKRKSFNNFKKHINFRIKKKRKRLVEYTVHDTGHHIPHSMDA